jgi:hypothetical protein
MMEGFEQELKNALRRKDPPADFEARVLAAAAGGNRDARPDARKRNGRRWGMPIAAALVLTAGIAWQRERAAEEQAAGQAARARLKLALQITSAKLHRIHETLEASE